MAKADEPRAQLRARRGLEVDRLVRVDLPAWRVERRLRVVAVVDEAHERLHVARWLDGPAHDAERRVWLAVARGEARDDRVIRPLARADRVRMCGIAGEPRAAI